VRKRLNGNGKDILPEIAIIAFELGILLAFFMSARALALIESLLIIALGVLCINKDKS
jgi:hypothetical protein